jgi:DNA polymerase I-like protein with 3'-5' exonuclease and polymerase domains
LTNIPKNDKNVLYGKEFRELFTCAPGRVLIGIDEDQSEMRLLGHDMNDPIFNADLLDGSIHNKNLERFQVNTKAVAKALGFGTIYGAGVPRVMEITGFDYKQSKSILNRIYESMPLLKKLKSEIEAYYQYYGYILLIDGRICVPANKNAALNARIQGNGGIVNKIITCFTDKYLTEQNLDAKLIGNFHDEHIYDCLDIPENIEAVKRVLNRAYEDTNKFLGLKVPITGTPNVGKTWAEIK